MMELALKKPVKGRGFTAKATALFAMLCFLTMAFLPNTAAAQDGQKLFNSNCASCHRADDVKVVGPGLAGSTERYSIEWLIEWTKDSPGMIAAGDPDAIATYEANNKMPMIPFPNLSDEDIIAIFDFVDNGAGGGGDAAAAGGDVAASDGGSGSAPLTWKQKVWLYPLLGLVVIILLIAINTMSLGRRVVNQHGFVPPTNVRPNYGIIFMAILVIAFCIALMLKMGLEEQGTTLHMLMFGAFPYIAIIVFIIGSIYRYKNKSFKVSSLSSQFLEGKKLFWGSQPFHWGILVLFFGHLIAFMFPRAIIAWNGAPVRLLILEVSSFIFGLSALLGIILLIRRRLSTGRVLMVTNKMDMLVYVTLLVQILSGLGVAFFLRWGSSWFAGVLTPYLRSLFAFNPEIEAVSAMSLNNEWGWLVQIHIISAFFIIAIIPFTRFMHFLVAPIDYIWRRYQVVIWNWNRKAIRTSKRHIFGQKSRNH